VAAEEDAIQHYALLNAEHSLKVSKRNLEKESHKQPKDEVAHEKHVMRLDRLAERIHDLTDEIANIKAGKTRRDFKEGGGGRIEEKEPTEAEGESLDAISRENQAKVEEARTAEKQRGSVILPGKKQPASHDASPITDANFCKDTATT